MDAAGTSSNAALNKYIINEQNGTILSAGGAMAAQTIFEMGQGIGFFPGTFDPGDIIAYGIGALAWIGIDAAARRLYYSGLTKPIYSLLDIKDRRLLTNQ